MPTRKPNRLPGRRRYSQFGMLYLSSTLPYPFESNLSDKKIKQDVVVPGGQQIYVAPNGKLSYTIAHSAYIPPNSAVQTFNATSGTVNENLGQLTFQGLGGSGFLACPSKKSNGKWGGPYQVFVDVKALSDKDVPSGCKKDCLGFNALTAPYTGAPVWQYT
ncbi:MAG: hypothetical protein Q9223_001750 [Gallowayella weberi]